MIQSRQTSWNFVYDINILDLNVYSYFSRQRAEKLHSLSIRKAESIPYINSVLFYFFTYLQRLSDRIWDCLQKYMNYKTTY